MSSDGERGERLPLKIRRAAESDIGSIAAVYGHHVEHGFASFELERPSNEEMLHRYRDVIGNGFPYFVAEDDGRIVGYAYASTYRGRPAYRFTVENSVYIDPESQRTGAGRALLNAVIAECERLGYRQMIAVIGDSANAASIGLHAACGFERVAMLPAVGFKFGRWVDSVFMQRALGEGDRSAPSG